MITMVVVVVNFGIMMIIKETFEAFFIELYFVTAVCHCSDRDDLPRS